MSVRGNNRETSLQTNTWCSWRRLRAYHTIFRTQSVISSAFVVLCVEMRETETGFMLITIHIKHFISGGLWPGSFERHTSSINCLFFFFFYFFHFFVFFTPHCSPFVHLFVFFGGYTVRFGYIGAADCEYELSALFSRQTWTHSVSSAQERAVIYL